MCVIRRSALAAATLSLSALFAAPLVSAQDPAPGLGDLQGLADSTASRALTARGYVRQSESGDYGRWWNGGDRRGGAGRRGAGGGEDAFGEALVDIGLGRDVGHVDRCGRGGVRDGGCTTAGSAARQRRLRRDGAGQTCQRGEQQDVHEATSRAHGQVRRGQADVRMLPGPRAPTP